MISFHRQKITVVGLLVLTLLFVGCGSAKVPDMILERMDAYEETCLVVSKEGRVTSHTVGVFDKDYYNLDELRKMAQEEVAAFNTEHQKGTATSVSVERVEEILNTQGKIVVTYNYENAETYAAYHDETLYYGTVSQAEKDGFSFEGTAQILRNADGSQTVTSAELHNAAYAKKHVLITSAKAVIYCPYKAEYVSEGAVVREDGGVSTLDIADEGKPVIILLAR